MAAPSSVSPGRRTLIEALVGAVLGFAAWGFVGPRVISWWYEPPAAEALSCASSVTLALKQFVVMQLVITAVGAAVVTLFMFLIRRKLKARAASTSGTTGPTAV